MPPLYLVQQNTKIRIRNRRVQVEDESACRGKVRCVGQGAVTRAPGLVIV